MLQFFSKCRRRAFIAYSQPLWQERLSDSAPRLGLTACCPWTMLLMSSAPGDKRLCLKVRRAITAIKLCCRCLIRAGNGLTLGLRPATRYTGLIFKTTQSWVTSANSTLSSSWSTSATSKGQRCTRSSQLALALILRTQGQGTLQPRISMGALRPQ